MYVLIAKSGFIFKILRWYDTLKNGDVHEKFNFWKIQDLRPLNTCQKHFERILLIFLQMSVKFTESTQWYKFFLRSNSQT